LSVPELGNRARIRSEARAYEQGLPSDQRKRLGQFFSGVKLGKLLAHMALRSESVAVIDPMAGHGDLLDATWDAATESGISLDRLDGIEIDRPTADACRRRLADITENSRAPEPKIIAGDAFDPATVTALPKRLYDLVITNPPYVRYQSRSNGNGAEDNSRAHLLTIVANLLAGTDMEIWQALAKGHSGLADLSVPAWLLSSLIVRPGGRLALVVPATWRSRDYADVIRYLMLRCFSLEYVVEDTQPGWFSDALVRTHLIVARRLHNDEAAKPLSARSVWPTALWLQVAPEAADGDSLVGAAFRGDSPEARFAVWLRNGCPSPKAGLNVRRFDLQEEWASLRARIRRRRWYHQLETNGGELPLFAREQQHRAVTVPDSLRDILPESFPPDAFTTLEQAGIHVGQGLRTGCNRFFYVTACDLMDGGFVRVQASSLFGSRRFSVPADALRPVLRRQSEVAFIGDDDISEGRVLDLRNWVLPEDYSIVSDAKSAYAASGEKLPRIMPDELADFVRVAAISKLDEDHGKRIPELSAVCTNIRTPRNAKITPRFWYMLPDFAPRHLPAAFVPRIIHELPWVESNRDPAILIDANFSTFWTTGKDWSRYALKALLNSTWCRTFMEALGTPLGGGALKLEATHLRHLPVPVLSPAARGKLDKAGRQLTRDTSSLRSVIDEAILTSVLANHPSGLSIAGLTHAMNERAHNLSSARQRAA
jgi:hypothetical protein